MAIRLAPGWNPGSQLEEVVGAINWVCLRLEGNRSSGREEMGTVAIEGPGAGFVHTSGEYQSRNGRGFHGFDGYNSLDRSPVRDDCQAPDGVTKVETAR